MKTIVAIGIAIVALVIGAALGAAGSSGGTSSTGQVVTTKTVTGPGTSTVSTVTVTSLRAGAALVNYSGTGSGDSPPFTATTSSGIVVLTVSSLDPSVSVVGWFIYPANGGKLYAGNGEVNGKAGSTTFNVFGLTPGTNYYVDVVSANAAWQISVVEQK